MAASRALGCSAPNGRASHACTLADQLQLATKLVNVQAAQPTPMTMEL